MPADPLNHPYRGLFGGLVVEPAGSSWVEDPDSHMSATVFAAGGSAFRDFTLIGQDDADILLNGKSNYLAGNALSAVNYRTEPAIYRFGELLRKAVNNSIADWSNLTLTPPVSTGCSNAAVSGDVATLAGVNWANVGTSRYISNSLVGGDPQTPVFRAPAGMPARFRLLHAGGNGDNQQVFELSGHTWQVEPYVADSAAIGNNAGSPVVGVASGYGVSSHFDVVIPSAGGTAQIPGDYVYRTWTADQFQVGFWGLFRVAPPPPTGVVADTVAVTRVAVGDGGKYLVSGFVTVRPSPDPAERGYASELQLKIDGAAMRAKVDADGRWRAELGKDPTHIDVTSPNGGVASWDRSGAPRIAALAAARISPQAEQVPPRVRVQGRRRVGLLR
jgi:hypothetical protein